MSRWRQPGGPMNATRSGWRAAVASGRRTTRPAEESRAGPEALLLLDEDPHQPLVPVGRQLPEPEAHQTPGTAAGLDRDGDALTFARPLQGLAHGGLAVGNGTARRRRAGEGDRNRFGREPELPLQP